MRKEQKKEEEEDDVEMCRLPNRALECVDFQSNACGQWWDLAMELLGCFLVYKYPNVFVYL